MFDQAYQKRLFFVNISLKQEKPLYNTWKD